MISAGFLCDRMNVQFVDGAKGIENSENIIKVADGRNTNGYINSYLPRIIY